MSTRPKALSEEEFYGGKAVRPGLIAIDLGAGSCRVSLLRWFSDGAVFHIVHRFENHPVIVGSSLRWDLDNIQSEVARGIRACADRAPEGIASLGVDGWSVDYVRLNTRGEALEAPFCYRDQRTVASSRAVAEMIAPSDLQALTGMPPLNILTIHQLKSDLDSHAELCLEHRPAWVQFPEFMLAWLGGKPVAEITNASHTGLVDWRTQTWSPRLLRMLDIPATAAPEIVASGTDLGLLQGDLAWLPALRKTRLIAPACHDTASAVASLSSDLPHEAYVSAGTWLLTGATFALDGSGSSPAPPDFLCLRGVGDRLCVHQATSGMWLIAECMRRWREEGYDWTFRALELEAARQNPSGIVFDVDTPDLMTPGDMPARIHSALSAQGHGAVDTTGRNAPQVLAIILQSLASKVASVLNVLEAHSGIRFARVHVFGGGARHRHFLNLIAQETGKEVVRGSFEASTLGNFAIQADLQHRSWPGTPPTARDVSHWSSHISQTLE